MVIKQMRWKAIFSDIDDDDKQRKTYGLKTFKCPPQVKELANFENDLLDLVKKVEFDDNFARSQFQKKLQEDIGKITKSKKTLTAADKTSNMYRLTKEEHDKLVHNAVTKTYKKAPEGIKERIDKEGVGIAKKAGVLDKMEINGTGNCYITLKDHKDNFANKPTVIN